MTCMICRRPETEVKDWAESLKYLKSEKLLCDSHEKEADGIIALEPPEPKKFILKQEHKQVLPPVREPDKNFYERDPGEDG